MISKKYSVEKVNPRYGIFILLVCFCQFGFGQDSITVKGFLKDSITGVPIANAHILPRGGNVIVTNQDGSFTFTIDSLPFGLKISHISYGINEVTINNIPVDEQLVIRLIPFSQRVDEVQISGNRLRILTKSKDYSIVDMAFDKKHLWMIGYENNIHDHCYIYLANPYGDTLCSRKIPPPANLYKDVFENVHIEFKDSVYQLFSPDNSSIDFLFGIDKAYFHSILDPVRAKIGKMLVFFACNQYKEEVLVYGRHASSPENLFISLITDSTEALRKEDERREKSASMWLDLKKTRYWRSNTKISRIYEDFLIPPLFALNDTLYIANFFKDSLMRYSPEGRYSGSTSICFHKDSFLMDKDDYKDIEFLIDNSTNSCYILERRTTRWLLHQLNHQTGKIEKKILLPDYPGMTHISVFQNAIYFLYDEKIYPYFVRLYRYQL